MTVIYNSVLLPDFRGSLQVRFAFLHIWRAKLLSRRLLQELFTGTMKQR